MHIPIYIVTHPTYISKTIPSHYHLSTFYYPLPSLSIFTHKPTLSFHGHLEFARSNLREKEKDKRSQRDATDDNKRLRSHFLPPRPLHAPIPSATRGEKTRGPIPRDKENDVEEKEGREGEGEEDGQLASRLYSGRGSIRSIHQWVVSCVITRRDTGGGRVYTVHRPCCARASVACAHGSLTTEAFAGYGRVPSSPLLPREARMPTSSSLPPWPARFFPRPSREHTRTPIHSLPGESVCGLPDPRSGINHNVEGQGRTSGEPDLPSFQFFSNFNLKGFRYFPFYVVFFWITVRDKGIEIPRSVLLSFRVLLVFRVCNSIILVEVIFPVEFEYDGFACMWSLSRDSFVQLRAVLNLVIWN